MTSPLIDLSNTITEAVEHTGKTIVAVNARQRFPSSGIHWQPGIVVTTNHSLKGDEEISVTWRKYPLSDSSRSRSQYRLGGAARRRDGQ
jgi:hypothetical protein